MKLKLINIGRNKINESFNIKNSGKTEISKILSKYILSNDFYFIEDENEKNLYSVIAGFREIGQIKIEN
jgi:hypothetical protein